MHTQRFIVIVSPRGGTQRSLAMLEEIKPILEATGAELDVRITTHSGHAEGMAKTMGPPRYTMAALIHILRARRRRAKVILNARVVEDEFLLFVAACNTRFVGKGMLLASNAAIDDGKIGVVLVRRTSRLQMLMLFKNVFDGLHLSLPCTANNQDLRAVREFFVQTTKFLWLRRTNQPRWVEYHQVRSFGIESEGVDSLNLDGELKGVTPVSAEIMPTALQVFA